MSITVGVDDPRERSTASISVMTTPRFGVSYTVSVSAQFEPPHELLDGFFTARLSTPDHCDALHEDLHARREVGCVVDRNSGGFRYGVREGAVVVSFQSRSIAVEFECFVGLVEDWREHLTRAPTRVDHVGAEAAAAQRRVAAVSWIESAIGLAAGNGWSREAIDLTRMRRSIDDASVDQITALAEAGATWVPVRSALADRHRGPQLDSIIDALDHLLGTG